MHGVHDPLPQVETQPSGDTEEGKDSCWVGDLGIREEVIWRLSLAERQVSQVEGEAKAGS